MEIDQDSKRLKWISSVHYIDLKKIKHEFNIISENELDSLFKEDKKIDNLKMILYFIYEQDISDILQVMMNEEHDDHSDIEKMAENNAEIWQLVREFKDIFQNELSDELPPQRALNHHINTGTTASINRNAYPLFIQQLKE